MNHVSLARICYDAVRAYARTFGERYVRWDDARPWEQESFSGAAAFLLEAPAATVVDLHGHWLAARMQRGWRHGPVRDATLRLHPALLPWDDVPRRERLKFELVHAVVGVFRGNVVPRLDLASGFGRE
ncbi:MAG: hypothetical protein JNL71_05630 [Rhodospirillales bacterium]|nr:hypothetical protein [Rhodospirillales bacterium]